MARKTFDRRQIENGPRNGEWMNVEVDTHSLSMLEFESGAMGSMTISFDIWDSETPRFEIYGTEAQFAFLILIPFMGQTISTAQYGIAHARKSRWEFQPRPTDRPAEWCIAENRHGFNENSRGLGLLDLSYAVKERPRAKGQW